MQETPGGSFRKFYTRSSPWKGPKSWSRVVQDVAGQGRSKLALGRKIVPRAPHFATMRQWLRATRAPDFGMLPEDPRPTLSTPPDRAHCEGYRGGLWPPPRAAGADDRPRYHHRERRGNTPGAQRGMPRVLTGLGVACCTKGGRQEGSPGPGPSRAAAILTNTPLAAHLYPPVGRYRRSGPRRASQGHRGPDFSPT